MNAYLATLFAIFLTIRAIFSFYLECFSNFIKSLGTLEERRNDIQLAYRAAYSYYLNKKGENK